MSKKKYESPSLFKHKEQVKAISTLKKQGFTDVTLNNNCVLMQRITADNYVEQVQVSYTGRVQKFKPWKPSPQEKARLSKVAEASRNYNY